VDAPTANDPATGARWDDAVNVRVMQKILSPSVQDAEETDLSSQMFGIGCNLEQRFRAGAKQETIESLFVLQRQ
jgi:hypothetical protein